MSLKEAARLINKNNFHILFIIFFVLRVEPAFSQTGKAQNLKNLSTIKKNTTPLKQVKTYIHPIRNFRIAVPTGAELIERGAAVQVSIRSKRGYIINIQSGDTNTSLSLLDMMAKLEKKYLGMGKPWSHKIFESHLTLAGLAAVKAIYNGADTRAQVVIVRGQKTDLVIMFFAPAEHFEKLELEFKWFLTNFSPDVIELSENNKISKKQIPETSISLPLLFSPKQFSNTSYGFSIQYPKKWIVSKSIDKSIVSFSSEKGTQDSQIVVSIQNVRPEAVSTSSEVIQKASTELKNSLIQDSINFKVIEEKLINFTSGKIRIPGRQIISTYTYSGNRYRKWSVLIPRSDDTIVHIWSYTAPELYFLKFSPIANTMLKSLIILTSYK
jgi:hypothetical protein